MPKIEKNRKNIVKSELACMEIQHRKTRDFRLDKTKTKMCGSTKKYQIMK